MTDFSNNITINPEGDGYEVRYRLLVNANAMSRRKKFSTEKEAIVFAQDLQVHLSRNGIGKKAQFQPNVEMQWGQRVTITDALRLYKSWLIEHTTTQKHQDIVLSMLAKRTQEVGLQYIDEITYSAVGSMIKYYKHKADHGRGFCFALKAFLRRIDKANNIKSDAKVQLYGSDQEIESTDEPMGKGVYTLQERSRLLEAMMGPNAALDLPQGKGRGRKSQESKDRAAATIFYKRRMAFLPLYMYLDRYGNRAMTAQRITVAMWDPELMKFNFPPTKTNKKQPKEVFVDKMMASLFNSCAEGKSPQEFLFSPAYTRGAGLLNPQWHTQEMNRLFKAVARSIGLRGTLNWLRHTASTELCKELGGNLRLVADMTGHSQVSTLQRYLHTPDDHKRLLADMYNEKDDLSPEIEQIRRLLQEEEKLSDDTAGPLNPSDLSASQQTAKKSTDLSFPNYNPQLEDNEEDGLAQGVLS